jgi:hypothetical protein
VLAALGEAVCCPVTVVGFVKCGIDGSVECLFNEDQPLMLFEEDFMNTEMRAVAGDMIYIF